MNKKRYLGMVGIVAAVVLLSILFNTTLANHWPAITSLIANAVWTTPSGSLQVTCDASDPDGGELNYEWSATAGNITGTGLEVIWTAPQEVGIYDITVVVQDGYGEEDTMFVHLSVA